MKEYDGNTFEIQELEEGDFVQVEFSLFSSGGGRGFYVDTKGLETLLEKIHDKEQDLHRKNPRLSEELRASGVDIPGELYAATFAIENIYHEEVGLEVDMAERRDMYTESNPPLSRALDQEPSCAELAAVAQIYLQRREFSSTYFTGGFLEDEEVPFPDQHTFNPLYRDQTMIFDPARPFVRRAESGGTVLSPAIRAIDGFPDQLKENEQSFLPAEDLTDGDRRWYGTCKGVNVTSEQLLDN